MMRRVARSPNDGDAEKGMADEREFKAGGGEIYVRAE
jgi:hypothetical protein